MSLIDVTSFGGIAADTDALLRDCFTKHPAYAAARSGDKFLVIGRKGSGKTAIFQKLLLESSHDFFSVGHTFDDYPWHHHDLQAQTGVPTERRYVHSWKYLVLMTLTKILLNRDNSVYVSESSLEAIGKLENFVVDSYGSRDPDVTQLFSPERRLKVKAGLNIQLLKLEGEQLRVRDLPVHIQEVNREVERLALEAMNPDNQYFVCFDQLDLGFNPSDPTYLDRVTGLILAARDLKRAARRAGRKLTVVVFLRDDLYGLLQFEDKNKLTEENLTQVNWDTGRDGEPTLADLMSRRFGQTIRGDERLDWDSVFDETEEMPSRQTKYQHICDRTFLRPRDMIKFCNEALVTYKERGGTEKFRNSDVHGARPEYSEYLLRELDDEIAKHVPHYKDYLEILTSIGFEQFDRETFAEEWEKREQLRDSSPTNALQELFGFSVIGYLRTGGSGGGSKWAWRYLDPRPYRAYLPPDAEKLRVHRGFKEALNLKQGSAQDRTS